MQINKAAATIYLNRTHPKQNMECGVYIRVTHDRIRRYFPTSYSLTIVDFEKAISDKPGKRLEDVANKIQGAKVEAQNIIRSLSSFSFEQFEKKFISNRSSKDTLVDIFDSAIKKLNDNDQIGTATSYNCAKNSIESFKPGLRLQDITVTLLYQYEKWMLDRSKSTTTISIYLRHLRTLFNQAIEDKFVNKDQYPFGARRYEIPQSNNIKKALNLKDIGLIYQYKAIPRTTTEKAKNYWLFLYLSNGMNMKDMALLKYENIKGNIIEFKRAKTARTKRTVEAIRVVITPDIDAIIKKFGNKVIQPDNYIFPILTKGLTAKRQRQLIQQITSVVNDHLKIIAKELRIQAQVTVQYARHSFATILQRSGVDVAFISESLGHSNLKTTQNYLAGFEDSKKIEVANLLTSFKQDGKANKRTVKKSD
ncbi:site-specific integrase [soil metagenome]